MTLTHDYDSPIASVASKGGDLTGLIGQLGGNFGSTTNVLSGLTGQQTSGDPTQLATSIISVRDVSVWTVVLGIDLMELKSSVWIVSRF